MRGLLLALLLLATPAFARPGQKPKPIPSAPSYAERVALVKKGKLPGFFEPNDLTKPPVLSAPSALLLDYDTGEVLFESEADSRHFPASTTKILTALLFIENTKPDDIVVCTDPTVVKIEPSTLSIKPGERFRAEQLLYGFILRSANDGGVVIAEHVAGSVASFARKMNERAAALGATNSHFVNPHGLHDPNHYTTARDLGMIARAAMQNPRFSDAVGTPRRTINRSINFKDIVVSSKAKGKFYDKVLGADGIKTGYTRAAGHCFVGSVTRGGRRLIAVILAAPSNAIGDTTPLLEWGFRRFSAKTVTVQGHSVGFVPVQSGSVDQVAVRSATTFHVPIDTLHPGTIQTRIESTKLTAPIVANQEVGRLLVLRDGKPVGSIALQAARGVPHLAASAKMRRPLPWLIVAGGAGVLFLIRYRHGHPFTPGNARTPHPSPKSNRRRRNRVPPTS